jgi:hypothetical protein
MNEPERDENDSQPPILDYAGRLYGSSDRPTTGTQIMAGILCSLLSDFVFIASVATLNSLWIGVPVLAASLILSTVLVGRSVGLRGFIPGIVIGFSLTCLVPLGISEVFCGNLSKL